jgi:FixJ family two-component response regulator
MRAQNLYNGGPVVGCRFAFTLPVEIPAIARECRDPRRKAEPWRPTTHEPDPQEGHRLRRRRRRGRARFAAVAARGKDYRVKCFDSAESFLSRFDPREVACLIADIRMDGMSGLELQDRCSSAQEPAAGGLHHRPRRRADGGDDDEEGRDGLHREAVQGGRAAQGLVERMLEQARSAFSQHQEQASRDALLSRLTTREAQVLERIVAGRLNKQIADDLGISIKTVEAHRANIMEKLNANTVADLLKIALGAQHAA